jgi:RimJ/RimL family protein N-acetyltransferase
MKIVKIKSNDLFISNFALKDITRSYIAWLNNKKLLKYSNNKFANFNQKKCVNFLKSFKNSQNLFLSIKNSNLELIGTITCYFFCNNKICDIGILLGSKKYSSKGLGFQSWIMIMKFLIDNYKLKKISAGTVKKNVKMISIFKKSGMIYDGFRKNNFYDKSFSDVVFYAKYL